MARSHTSSLAAAVLVLCTACDFGEMAAGESCAKCHNGGEAPRFGVAGTVYASPEAGQDEGLAGARTRHADHGGKP